jgi:membrane protein YdbS with pleckstrin-like domain
VTEGRRFRRRESDETATPRGGAPVHHPPAAGLPDQADPFGGSVLETGALWRRRYRRQRRGAQWVDPAQSATPPAPADDPAPVVSSPFAERLRAVRVHFLPLPEECVGRYLGGGEEVLYSDHPALAWFLARKALWVLGLAALLAGVIVALLQGWGLMALAFLGAALVVFLALCAQRMSDRYVSYVITNARMIRMSGVLKRLVESIPWVRVTDVHFEQSAVERALGCATLNIESANENTGLRRMSGIADPLEFNHHLTDMVVAKQGASVPLGRKSDYTIMPPPRGLFAFRRKRETRVGSALDVEQPKAEAPEDEAPAERPRRPVPVAPDPALPTDLSNMARVSESEMEADNRRQDTLLGRDAEK